MGRSVINEKLDGKLKMMSDKLDALVFDTVRPIAGSLLVAAAFFCFALMSVHAQTVDLDNGLVAYYPLNGNANDASGNGNHGVVVGAAASVADRHGNQNSALNTSVAEGETANSNHIKAPVAGSLTESFSVTGWFKFEESKSPYAKDHLFTIIPDGNLNGTRIFVSINHQWDPNEIRIESFHQEDGYLGSVILNGNFKELFENKWAHIVLASRRKSQKYISTVRSRIIIRKF